MFKKRGQKFARKRLEVDKDDSEPEEEPQPIIQQKAQTEVSEKKKKKKKKSTKKEPSSLLSFGDDIDNGEEVTFKKSSRNTKIANRLKKQIKQELQQQGGAKEKKKKNNVHSSKEAPKSSIPINYEDIVLPGEEQEDVVVAPGRDFIPDSSTIYAAKRQREMQRKMGQETVLAREEDTTKYKSHQSSRMVREEDEEGSSGDEVMKMQGYMARSMRGEGLEDEEGDEEESRKWEEQLIKKGSYGLNIEQVKDQYKQSYNAPANNYYGSYKPPPVMTAKLATNTTMESIKSRLRKTLDEKEKVYEENKEKERELMFDKKECEDIALHLKDSKKVGEQYIFFQEIRYYILDLVGCLRVMQPHILALEKSMMDQWKKCSKKLRERRKKDQIDEDSQSKNVPMDKTTAEGEAFVARVREREARRQRRAEQRRFQNENSHNDGMSTDDEESPSDKAVYNSEVSRVQTEKQGLFAEALEEFSSVSAVLDKFSNWRENHTDSYYDAFIALCIPQILLPFIKFHLIFWNPFRDSDNNFENDDWFKNVANYSLKNLLSSLNLIEFNADSRFKEDANIISTLVEKSILEKLNKLVLEVWDPMSSKQTNALVNLLETFSEYPFMKGDNKVLENLMRSACKKMQECISNDVYIPYNGDDSATAQKYFDRQCWSVIKLFKNVMKFNKYLSFEVLSELAFENLLNRYIVWSFELSNPDVKCLTKVAAVVREIPEQIIKCEESGAALQKLCSFIENFAVKAKNNGSSSGKKMAETLKVLLGILKPDGV